MREFIIYGKVVGTKKVFDNGAVLVRNGTVAYVGDRCGAPAVSEIYEADIIMPGFVDIHCHAGGDVWSHEDPVSVADYHFTKGGTTTMCQTLYRDLGADGILKALKKIKDAMKLCPQIAGAHLEGPYLNPKYGAMSGDGKVVCRAEEYIPMLESGIVRHVTYAPEVEGTDALQEDLNRYGIVGSIGHSAASADDVHRAAMQGARNVTHLFDATGASISPTRWAGTIEADFNCAALLENCFTYEIICDRNGVHVRPEMVRLAAKTVGVDNIIGITDACGGGGEGDDVNFLDGELNGSKLTMNKVAENFAAMGFSLPDVAKITSANAAKLLGMYDSIGSLEIGKKADIVALNKDFSVKKVFKANSAV